ncbi:MAG: aminotransferase class I/II-fold pyridoxal phosphate-dependent enzyme [Pirellulales bacterium]
MNAGVDHERAPLWETLTGYAQSGIYPFHTPGHKGGHFAPPELKEMLGARCLALDLPGMTATDNTFHPTGCVRQAQRLASDLFGSAQTFFLSAGSTLGVAAALLAAVRPGEIVALPRNIHRSVVAGLVLSGAVPRFVPHGVLSECGALGVSAAALAEALDAAPRPAAVLLTRPSYYGLARELADVVAVCRARRIPLIADEAHGAHLHFLPQGNPEPALAAGADLVVQSCHKTLGSLVGSAQLHVGRGSLVDAVRVQEALNFLQTTSPNYLMLASLDLMRRWMWREGCQLFTEAVAAALQLEQEVDAMPGLRVFRTEREPCLADHRRDPLRMVVNVSGSGWTGYEVERHLRTEFRVEDEMADWFNAVYVLSPQDDPAARGRLLAGLRAVSQSPKAVRGGGPQGANREESRQHELLQPPIPPMVTSPREAALARKASVSLAAAAGRTSGEMVMFYPPGIPLLIPGEQVTPETIDVCRQLLAAGGNLYASDPTLETVRVVES